MGTIPTDFWGLAGFMGVRILFAILCGGLVGIERELKAKPAGMKTNILICLGSALYTTVSVILAAQFSENGHYGDPARVAAQIVPGIGFLGGGAIIQTRGTILGLTTAATIWVVAALGILIGIGHGGLAVLGTLSVLGILVFTNWFEDRVLGRALSFEIQVTVDDPKGEVRLLLNQALAQNNLILDDFDLSPRGNLSVIQCKYTGHRTDHKKLVLELWGLSGIKEVKQL